MKVTKTYTEEKTSLQDVMTKIVQEYIDRSCKNICSTVELNVNKENI